MYTNENATEQDRGRLEPGPGEWVLNLLRKEGYYDVLSITDEAWLWALCRATWPREEKVIIALDTE